MRFLQNEEGSAGDATSNGATAAGDAAGVNLADAMKDPGAVLNDAQGWLSENMPRLIEWGVQIIGVLIILVLAWIVAGWASRITRRALTRANLDLTLTRFFGKLVKYAILIAAIIACLGQFGFEMTTFAAVIAAAGFAVGLAFQGTLSNFSAGVMLLAFRPFKVDDVVNIGGVTGKVFEIGIFTTAIDTFDNRRFIVPNGEIFGATIENITHHPIRRVDVNVGVEYPADIDQTRAVLDAAIATLDTVLEDPAPAVVLSGLGDSAVDWTLRVWVNAGDYWPTREALLRATKMKLDEAGIGIPFPQMDVHLFKQNDDGS